MGMESIRDRVESLAAVGGDDFPRREALEVFEELRGLLNRGEVRSAEPDGMGAGHDPAS